MNSCNSDLKFYTKSVKQVCLIQPVSEDIVAFLREPVNVEKSVARLSPILKSTAITALNEVSQKRYSIKFYGIKLKLKKYI